MRFLLEFYQRFLHEFHQRFSQIFEQSFLQGFLLELHQGFFRNCTKDSSKITARKFLRNSNRDSFNNYSMNFEQPINHAFQKDFRHGLLLWISRVSFRYSFWVLTKKKSGYFNYDPFFTDTPKNGPEIPAGIPGFFRGFIINISSNT